MSHVRRQIAQAQSEERSLTDEWGVAGKREALLLGLQVLRRDDCYLDGIKQPETKQLLVALIGFISARLNAACVCAAECCAGALRQRTWSLG